MLNLFDVIDPSGFFPQVELLVMGINLTYNNTVLIKTKKQKKGKEKKKRNKRKDRKEESIINYYLVEIVHHF